MKLRMKNGYLAIQPLTGEKQTDSGIVVPENVDETQTTHGVVFATSEGSEYKKNDIVLFSKLVPDDVSIKDDKGMPTELWFVLESDIKAQIK